MNISRIYRLLRVVTLLQSGRCYSARELAEELQVSRRTVFRDLNMLEMAHIPYYFDSDRGGYRINQNFFLPPVNLTLGEALAVLMLTGRLTNAGELPLLAHGTQAAAKLQSVLPARVRRHVGDVLDHLSVRLGPVASHEGLDSTFQLLSSAIAARNVCRIVYISFADRRQLELTIHPLRLLFHSRAWYLLGFTPKYEQVRTYKLGRIRSLAVGQETFQPPRDVDLDHPFGQAWSMIPEGRVYDVHLRFSPIVAGNVAEVRWHRSQQVEWKDDGSIDFRVTVDGLGEISWWILGYGEQVEVLAPAALRERVAATASAVAGKYGLEVPR